MRQARWLPALLVAGVLHGVQAQQTPPPPAADPPKPKGHLLDPLAWPEAGQRLAAAQVVVLPVGAAARQHGHHLPINTDAVVIDHLRRAVAMRADIVVAPSLTSTSDPLGEPYPVYQGHPLRTIRDLIVEACTRLARDGPKRFLLVDADAPSLEAYTVAAQQLVAEGILLRSVDALRLAADRPTPASDTRSAHADLIETSLVLAIDPALVNMARATREENFSPMRQIAMRQRPTPSGVRGDATSATKSAGERYLQQILDGLVKEIEITRTAPIASPPARPASTGPTSVGAPAGAPEGGGRDAAIREIVRLVRQFETYWFQKDAVLLASLWTEEGDVGHPDGQIEKPRFTIQYNRTRLFATREYRNSRHPMKVGPISFIGNGVAVVDGLWEMTGMMTPQNQPAPGAKGPFAMVVTNAGDGWRIAAYRYMLTPQP
jgi:creatinine amidohydrolase